MDALYLALIGLLFWPVIRSFAEFFIAVRDRKPGKRAPMVDAAGWFTVSMLCLVGAATCMERQVPLAAVGFAALAMARIVAPRVDGAVAGVLAYARAGRSDR